jgi:hypothetical protein
MPGYEADRERIGRLRKEQSTTGRDIGGVPDIADVARRERCRGSLKLFCETYAPSSFPLAWSANHLKAIARLEEAVVEGALFAFAMPRGSGKTTLTRTAALYALSYSLRRYCVVVCANHEKAQDGVNAVATLIRFAPEYAADFPEISYPAQKLAGIANRARGQLCGGQSTLIEWGKDRLVLPTVPPPENWPAHWPLREDGMVPTSGQVLSGTGLTADGIRGAVLMLTTGEALRPDLVLIDDPQTAESAHSLSQCVTRERLLSADVLGMAGPGKSISAVCTCTVIRPGDLADTLLDRTKHPLWRGERTKLLDSMPEDLPAWEPYLALWRQDAQREPPDFSRSLAYYALHRGRLEQGALASWPERKLPGEVSAVQSAMHLYARDRAAFFSEYQNDPLPTAGSEAPQLQADDVAARVTREPRGVVPPGTTTLTGFVDVGQDLLYWCVCAWADGFTGSVVDYGTWPDQRRDYFRASEARPTLAQAVGIASLEGSLYAALGRLCEDLLGREWPQAGGAGLRVGRLLVDSGWQTELVYRLCRQSPHAGLLLPSKGLAIGARQAPVSEWARREGERHGEALPWVIRPPQQARPRLLIFDANAAKSFVAARLAQPLGEKGALTLWGADPQAHRLLADHLCAEYRVRTSGRGRELDEWQVRPERPDNHYFDALVGCAVAASVEGCRLSGTGEGPPPERVRRSWREMQRRKQEERRREGR